MGSCSLPFFELLFPLRQKKLLSFNIFAGASLFRLQKVNHGGFSGMGPVELKPNQIELAPSDSRKYSAWPSRT
jgi:hypothetical protein